MIHTKTCLFYDQKTRQNKSIFIFHAKLSIYYCIVHVHRRCVFDLNFPPRSKSIHISHSALLKGSTGKKMHLSERYMDGFDLIVMTNTGFALKYSNLVEMIAFWAFYPCNCQNLSKHMSKNMSKKEPFFPRLWGYWASLTIYFKIFA